jgi:hypothetical protein
MRGQRLDLGIAEFGKQGMGLRGGSVRPRALRIDCNDQMV